MISTHPSRTCSHVSGLSARAPCRTVTRVTDPSPLAGVNTHSTRPGASSDMAAS